MTRGIPALVPFDHSAFPYDGEGLEPGKPFLDVTDGTRRGHRTPRGGIRWDDETYWDKRSLLFVPPRFDARKPAALVLFFHGNRATLERDVAARQGVPRQLAASHLNAVLVAPQMAVDAPDSSAGHFAEQGFLDAYLDEAEDRLTALSKGRLRRGDLDRLPLVIVAYSGGYLPTAFSLARSKTRRAILGVVLLDALFGETETFETWVLRAHTDAFFLSASSKASRSENEALKARLEAEGVMTGPDASGRLKPGTVDFIAAPEAAHNDFVTQAWRRDPLAAIFARIALAKTGP